MIHLKSGLVVTVILLGLILRLHNYEIYPQRGASSDEYSYSFLGVSLLTKHVPISWSNIAAYKNKYDLTIRSLYFPMVYPYFDHPPLNGLVVGGWALLFGQDTFEKIDLKTIRLVPIFLSVISSLFVFLFGTRLYNYKTGMWALLIFTTTPLFAMNQRVVFAENLLTPLLLATLYFFHLFKKNLTFSKAIILGVLCGFSFWTKELGISVFIAMLYLFASESVKPKFVLALSLTSLFFVLLYAGYGTYYDKDTFWAIISAQSNRNIGPQTFTLLTSTPIIVNKIYYDGWYFFGFLSFFLSFLEYKKHKLLLAPAAAYFMLLVFSLNREGEMGWYMIPLFPFMALFSARVLVIELQKQSWFIFILLLFVGLAQLKFFYEDNFGLTPIQFRTLLFFMFGPFILLFIAKKERAFRWLAHAWFYLLIFGNILLTYNYIHPA